MVKIFIDAGHGGNDSGAVGNGLQEKNLTLNIANRIRTKLNEYENVQVRMSRTSDQSVSLAQRTTNANSWGADVYVSVHINAAGSSSAGGFESFIYPNVGQRTVNVQNAVHEEIMKQLNRFGVRDRGKKRADFHVLRETSMDAILTENLFITNKSDSDLLKRSDFLDAVATGHVNGLARFFGLKKKTSNPPPGSLYFVQIGAFSQKANADSLANKAKSDGYDSFVKQDGSFYVVQIGAFSNLDNARALERKAKNDGYDVFVKQG